VSALLLLLYDCDFICCDYQHTRQRVCQILGVMSFAMVDNCKPNTNTIETAEAVCETDYKV
jgi:hypothetical protein